MTDPFTSSAPAARPKGTGVDVRDTEAVRDYLGRYMIPDLPADYRAQFAAQGYAAPSIKPKPRTRATTFAKSISDTFVLSAWSQRMVAKGLGSRPDLVVAAAAARVDDKATLDDIVQQAKDAAAARASANVGTAVHTLTEDDDRGILDIATVPKPYDLDVLAWRTALAKHQLRTAPEYIERSVLNTRWNIGGSFDRLFQLPDGTWVVGDLKTGRDLQYGWNEIAIQLVVYGDADAIYDWGREVFLPMPDGLRTDYALVVHLPAGTGRAEVYRVDLILAREAADLCLAVRKWRSERNLAELLTVVDEAETEEPVTLFQRQLVRELGPVQVCPLCGHLPGRGCNCSPDKGAAYVCPLCGGTHPADESCEDPADAHQRRVDEGRDAADRLMGLGATSAPQTAQNEPAGTEHQAVATDAMGGPLGELVGPGERGCSVCRRKGHKKGSPKCWGDQDPETMPAPVSTREETQDQHMEVLGRQIGAALATTGDASHIVTALQSGEGNAGRPPKVCAHTDGWSTRPDGTTFCSSCGKEGAVPVLPDRKLEPGTLGAPVARHPVADVDQGGFCNAMVLRDGYGDTCGLKQDDPVHLAPADPTVLEDGGDPFADEPMPAPKPVKARPPTDLERVQRAGSTGELAEIGRELAKVGRMTDEIRAAGKARRTQLTEPAG